MVSSNISTQPLDNLSPQRWRQPRRHLNIVCLVRVYLRQVKTVPSMKTLRACLAAGFLVVSAAGSLHADDSLRHYQQSLRDQGFYYGPINGSTSDETTQALRRYQIRNGLAVTGQLDDDTRRSIDRAATESAQATPGPLVEPPAATPPPARRPVATPIPRAPVARQDEQPDPRDQGPGPGPGPGPSDNRADGRTRVAPSAPLTNYFGGTPYEFAPPPVQADAIARAQKLLTRTGFYDGEVNGRPNHDLADAVTNFQEVNRLRRSGRLDHRYPRCHAVVAGPARRPWPARGY